MDSMFYRVIKEDCQKMSFSQKENGLLEIVMPKDYDNKELSKFISGLGSEEYSKIVDKQKKAKEVFRNKAKQMIDKYREEFKLPFLINLRIQTKTKKFNDCSVELHGIVFEGHLSLVFFLQYFSDELLEKIIRCTVFIMACEYEQRFSELDVVTTNVFNISDGGIKRINCTKIPKEAKYRITLEYSEIEKIKADYDAAYKQILDDMKKYPIMYTR